MKFNNFEIHAMPFFKGYCCCGENLKQVSNGFFSRAMYCPKCENVYLIKLVKAPKKIISKDFLQQAREEAGITK